MKRLFYNYPVLALSVILFWFEFSFKTKVLIQIFFLSKFKFLKGNIKQFITNFLIQTVLDNSLKRAKYNCL